MKVLVTGSSGFIGRHMVNALKTRHHAVRILDITIGKDIRNEDAVRKAVKGVDAVMHLAAIADIPYSFKHPAEVAEVNITGTINLLEACRRYDVKKFVFASSSAVYAEPEELPVNEDHPLKPLSPYGLTKLAAEQYVNLYGNIYGMSTISLRYFNVYGIGQTKGLVGNSINAIKNNRPMIIFGDGRQTRDFVNIADAVQANLLALHTKASSEVFNIGGGTETSVREVIGILQELTHANSVKYEPSREGEIRRMCADLGKARRKLGYRPKVSLRDGLAEVVNAG